MPTAIAIVIVCSGLVITLSGVVLLARRWLVPRGDVTITVNGRRQLTAALGERLLYALAQQDVLLPSACGGRGSCGQCRLQVLSGGDTILPVETALIRHREVTAGARLACMVTVRRDMNIVVPDSVLQAQRYVCTLEHTESITAFLRKLTIRLPAGADFQFRAGEFVLVDAPPGTTHFRDFRIQSPYHDTWSQRDLWHLSVTRTAVTTRAYSIANAPSADGVLQLVVRIALPGAAARRNAPPGMVSSYLFGLEAGSQLAVAGPFGNFHVRESLSEMVMIGGGAGIAPLRAMIIDQLENRASGRRISLWYGARNVDEICFEDEFNDLAARYPNFSWCAVLSASNLAASWEGRRGLVHAALRNEYIATHPSPEELEYYLCGPPLMSGAVTTMLEDFGVPPENVSFDDFGS
jgi:Na+-transporting NADH:ubiquinone oxidoreductase subunit F